MTCEERDGKLDFPIPGIHDRQLPPALLTASLKSWFSPLNDRFLNFGVRSERPLRVKLNVSFLHFG
jgi:hypothetical protein